MKHNIYLLEPTDKGWNYISYDCNKGQVVIADSAKEARETCKISDEGNIWICPKLVTCKKIGETNKAKGIVLISNMGA